MEAGLFSVYKCGLLERDDGHRKDAGGEEPHGEAAKGRGDILVIDLCLDPGKEQQGNGEAKPCAQRGSRGFGKAAAGGVCAGAENDAVERDEQVLIGEEVADDGGRDQHPESGDKGRIHTDADTGSAERCDERDRRDGKAVLCKRLCAALRAKRWGDAEELLQNDVIRKRAADYDKQKGFEVHRLRLLLFGTGRNDRVRSAAESGSALLADGADNGHDDRKHDEAAGGTCEQGDAVRLEEVKRDPGKAARAEDLSYRGGDKERRDEAEAGKEAILECRADALLRRALGLGENERINGEERGIDAEHVIDLGQPRVQKKLRHARKARDQHELGDEQRVLGKELLDKRGEKGREQHDRKRGDAQRESREHGGSRRKRRACAEEQDKHGILRNGCAKLIFVHQPSPPF